MRLGGPAETQCRAGLLVEKHLPTTLRTTPNTPVWLNSEVTSALKTKRRLAEKSKVRPDAEIQRSSKPAANAVRTAKRTLGVKETGQGENQKLVSRLCMFERQTQSKTAVGPLQDRGRNWSKAMKR